jgi:hypothetical protein
MCYNIDMLRTEKLGASGRYHIVVKDQHGNIKHDKYYDNLTTTVGRALIIERIFNATPSADLLVDYIAVGTGTTAPAVGDTTLETETARKLRVSLANSSNVGSVSTVFAAGDVPTSTLKEVGLFINGTGTVDTGTLLSRTAIDLPVTALDSVFIDYEFTLNDA